MIGQLAMETGWSLRYILCRVNVVMLSLMAADAPHYEEDRPKTAADYIREMQQREGNSANPAAPKGVDPMTYFSKMAIRD